MYGTIMLITNLTSLISNTKSTIEVVAIIVSLIEN